MSKDTRIEMKSKKFGTSLIANAFSLALRSGSLPSFSAFYMTYPSRMQHARDETRQKLNIRFIGTSRPFHP